MYSVTLLYQSRKERWFNFEKAEYFSWWKYVGKKRGEECGIRDCHLYSVGFFCI